MLGVAPAGFLAGDKFLGHLAKGPTLSCGKPLGLPLGHLRREGIDSIVTLFSVLCGPPTRLRKRDVGVGAEPHVPPLTVELEPEHPGFRSGLRDAKVKPAAVVQHRRPLRFAYFDRRELAGARHRHSPPCSGIRLGESQSIPHFVPPSAIEIVRYGEIQGAPKRPSTA